MTIELVSIAGRLVGPGHPCFVVAEIGINHNGDVNLALDLIDVAAAAGCDAVKFQKRTPELAIPEAEKSRQRETPWGSMTYLEYRERLELGREDYERIDERCCERGIIWFASCWDPPSVDFIEQFDPPCYKIASASLTDRPLLERLVATGRPLLISTGMSELEEIDAAVDFVRGRLPFLLLHCTSSYPAAATEINLGMIRVLEERYGCVVGYSGHEVGLQISLAAVSLGAALLERHVTLDRATWGSDHAASVEPPGLQRLVRDIRVIEEAFGDGIKRVYPSEIPLKARLRRMPALGGDSA